MKLKVRFLQLPILFDAARLAEEVAAIPESAWRPHPKQFRGNDALPLITTAGDPSSDARAGSMGPTPHLLACPYLMQALECLGATWGRSRLMRLSGDAEVTPHVDTDYYWRDHMRVHMPIVTQPTVRFLCGGEEVNMTAGECWIFDTWSLHSVHNDAARTRIHLVADTVGGDGLLNLIENGRSPSQPRSGWSTALTPPRETTKPELAYERCNAPEVMTPWELRDHLGFLLSEMAPGEPRLAKVAQSLNRLRVNWHALWAQFGDDQAARPKYTELLAQTWEHLESQGVNELQLKNQMPLGRCLQALIFSAALSDASSAIDGEERTAPADPDIRRAGRTPPASPGSAKASTTRDTLFDRPIFIVSPPRSGSTLLFETLSNAPDLYTIGGESHGLMEAIPAINPANSGWDSNRLAAADASTATVKILRERFRMALKDRGGRTASTEPVRMLEKTPKNALRIPFLAAAFPEARFIYLHRDPRPTLASMMEAWSSGKFRTYPQLPGWVGRDWSLLLTPGWRQLIGAPLNQIVAQQWATTTQILVDDLSTLPADRWCSVRYEAFIAAPQSELSRVCKAMDVAWYERLSDSLPIARYTLSSPSKDKWRAHSPAIDAVASVWTRPNQSALAVIQA